MTDKSMQFSINAIHISFDSKSRPVKVRKGPTFEVHEQDFVSKQVLAKFTG